MTKFIRLGYIPQCHYVLASAANTVTDKLQRVLNAAARVITGTRKFDRGLGQILHDQLHWLDVPDRVLVRLAVTVHQCLNGRAPPYLSEHCIPVSSADTRRHLRSAVIYLPYRVSGSTLTAVGRSQLLARWPGTHSRILSEIQRAAQTVLGVYLKRTSSRIRPTSASSALGVLNDYALYKSTHSLRETHSVSIQRRCVTDAVVVLMCFLRSRLRHRRVFDCMVAVRFETLFIEGKKKVKVAHTRLPSVGFRS